MYRRHVLASTVNESVSQDLPEEKTVLTACCTTYHADVEEHVSPIETTQPSPKSARRGPMRRQEKKMIHQLHRCMARSGVVAVAASASMLSRRMESISSMDSASKFRGRASSGRGSATALAGRGLLATLSAAAATSVTNASSVVLGGVAQICQAATDIANAIGEPPWRMPGNQAGVGAALDEQRETPLVLLWAVNFAIILILATVVLVAWAFIEQVTSAGAMEDEDFDEGHSLPGEPEITAVVGSSPSLSEARHLRCGVKALVVTTVSFLSGMGLSVIHPLQSALLCGI